MAAGVPWLLGPSDRVDKSALWVAEPMSVSDRGRRVARVSCQEWYQDPSIKETWNRRSVMWVVRLPGYSISINSQFSLISFVNADGGTDRGQHCLVLTLCGQCVGPKCSMLLVFLYARRVTRSTLLYYRMIHAHASCVYGFLLSRRRYSGDFFVHLGTANFIRTRIGVFSPLNLKTKEKENTQSNENSISPQCIYGCMLISSASD